MKRTILAVVACLVAGQALASNWISIKYTDKQVRGAKAFVDRESIVADGDIKKAWFKYQLFPEQRELPLQSFTDEEGHTFTIDPNEAGFGLAASTLESLHFNCHDRTYVETAYKELNLAGEIKKSVAFPASQLVLREISPDSFEEAAFKAVCNTKGNSIHQKRHHKHLKTI